MRAVAGRIVEDLHDFVVESPLTLALSPESGERERGDVAAVLLVVRDQSRRIRSLQSRDFLELAVRVVLKVRRLLPRRIRTP